ncbi:MAG TPA: hypothetical protein DD766_08100, partial [Desulfovibrio sp.]|nr:hypothetical protein [Desulfovibrio sp.]
RAGAGLAGERAQGLGRGPAGPGPDPAAGSPGPGPGGGPAPGIPARAGTRVPPALERAHVPGLARGVGRVSGFKVLLLAPSLDTGGTERQVVQLAGCLADRGLDVGLALCRKQGALLAEAAPGVRMFDLAKAGRADVPGFLWRAARLLRQERPQVLYSFLGTPNLAAALLKPLLPGTRLVWALRAGPDGAGPGRLARLCHWAEARLSWAPDAVVVNSEAGRNAALARGFPGERLALVPNGIDTRRFSPDRAAGAALRREWGGGERRRLVGLAARLDPVKDHETFLRAAAEVARTESGVRFV